MSDNKHRASLLNLRRPGANEKQALFVPTSVAAPELEDALLGKEGGLHPSAPEIEHELRQEKESTIPVTFHLPVRLRDKIRMTARAKNITMLEFAKAALETHLERHPVTEAELRALLNL